MSKPTQPKIENRIPAILTRIGKRGKTFASPRPAFGSETGNPGRCPLDPNGGRSILEEALGGYYGDRRDD